MRSWRRSAIVNEKVVIGIDGGGTRTRGALADLEGHVWAREETGASNPHVVGAAAARAAVRRLVGALLERAGVPSDSIAGWCCGMAGADRPEDREPFLALAEEFRCGDRLLVTTDALIALAGGTLSDRGVLVHAGTGSIVYGRDENTTARAGGWGRLLDDAGSGYAIGREALRRVMRAYDGRDGATALRDSLLVALNLKHETELVGWSSTAGNDAAQVAALAPIVLSIAAQGDAAAIDIADAAADELVLMVRALERRIALSSSTSIVLSGGLFEHVEYYAQLVTDKLRFYYPDMPIGKPKLPPVAGALLYALNRAGVRISKQLLEKLRETLERPVPPRPAAAHQPPPDNDVAPLELSEREDSRPTPADTAQPCADDAIEEQA